MILHWRNCHLFCNSRYAQAITSHYLDVLYEGDLLRGDMPLPPIEDCFVIGPDTGAIFHRNVRLFSDYSWLFSDCFRLFSTAFGPFLTALRLILFCFFAEPMEWITAQGRQKCSLPDNRAPCVPASLWQKFHHFKLVFKFKVHHFKCKIHHFYQVRFVPLLGGLTGNLRARAPWFFNIKQHKAPGPPRLRCSFLPGPAQPRAAEPVRRRAEVATRWARDRRGNPRTAAQGGRERGAGSVWQVLGGSSAEVALLTRQRVGWRRFGCWEYAGRRRSWLGCARTSTTLGIRDS